MKRLSLLAFMACSSVFADPQTAIYPTINGTGIRDFSEPGYLIEQDR
jgi:hypothetical protein